MLTEVMQRYGLTRPPVDVGFFETEHHTQLSRDIRIAIMGARLVAVTAVIGVRVATEQKTYISLWLSTTHAVRLPL